MAQAYRDEKEVIQQRLAAAIDRRDAAWAGLQERLQSIAALNEQLSARKQPVFPMPDTSLGTDTPQDRTALTMPELIRLTGQIERDTDRLQGDAQRLGPALMRLNDRLMGKFAIDPLSSPPRRVPAKYFVAEWMTWYSVISLWAAIASALLPSKFGTAVLSPVLFCLFFTAVRLGAMEFRLSAVSILLVSTLVVHLGAGAWFAMAASGSWFVPGAVLVVLAIDALRAALRMSFLRRCKVATVTSVSKESGSSGYSAWPLPHAIGWASSMEAYSGGSTVNRLKYATDEGHVDELVIKGREYENGVILYDTNKPSRALCVQSFGCSPRPDLSGAWSGLIGMRNGWRTTLGLVCVVCELALLAARAAGLGW